ncbi:DUF3515 domain-containing protein [Nocardioides litoris]|uniref:DUF3515 domain-containing protein n=1 Tax=Nocardioides litoris TaxID=1926648 RepID=UPI00111F7021|nr:DUF3515 domain-containing protein [Nocardioides litoris]
MPGRPHLSVRSTPSRRPGARWARGVRAPALGPGLTAVAAVAAAVVLGACSGPPEITSTDLDAAGRAACEAFTADLPDTLADQERVEVEPADALGAAYGDPPITVTCGVPLPEGFDQTSRCDEVDGVGWYVPDGSDADPTTDLRLAAPGYRPVVELRVPADYRPQDQNIGDDVTAGALGQLSGLVEEHLTLEQRCEG